MRDLRILRAPNPSALTLDGTRTFLVGHSRVAVIDPGPDLPEHVDAITDAVRGTDEVYILLTHRHPDHAGAAGALSRRIGASVHAFPSCSPAAGRNGESDLQAGDRIPTDAGDVEVVPTPGHTPDHVSFWWRERSALFAGDLMLGGMNTSLVASPEGDLGAYLDSLRRVRSLDLGVIYPTHGPPFTDPQEATEAYLAHRREREEQVLAALGISEAEPEELVERVYGADLAPGLAAAAEAALLAYLEHLADGGQVHRSAEGWRLA